MLVGLAGIAAIGVPLALTTSGGGGSLFRASPAGATTPDKILYAQTTGSQGTYIQYVPGDGSKPTKESVTSGGGCATPTPSGVPLLNFAGFLYPDGSYTPGSQTNGIVGAFKQRTGVCAIPQAWSIDNVPSGSQTGAEALDFSVGTNALVAGRVFSEAQLILQRSDKLTTATQVTLLEYLGANPAPVASQCFVLASSGASIPVDTTPSNTATPTCAAPASTDASLVGFDRIEIQVTSPNESVSVVGPSSTFIFASQICGGTTINTQSNQDANLGQVTFSLTLQESANVCKSYTSFSAQLNPGAQFERSATFNSFGAGNTHFTFTINWGDFPECTPDGSDNLPACPPTQVQVNGGAFTDQTYCDAATANNQVCTTHKNFAFVNVNGTTKTQITENWDGLIDVSFRSP